MRAAAFVLVAVLTSGCATAPPPAPPHSELRSADEISLRAIDERIRIAVQTGDAAQIEALMHPSYRVNAPSNRVITKEQVLGMIRSGAIAADRFERTIESISVAGDIGVVMGRELVELPSGRLFGTGALNRRFTNVYLRHGSGWLQVARHANVVPPATGK